jgi:DNA-directed RNA polymerase specialized sigma24 family protein
MNPNRKSSLTYFETNAADRDAYVDSLTNAAWADHRAKLVEYARQNGVHPDRIDDLVQATCLREIDPLTRTYRPWKSRTFIDHLKWVFDSQWKNVRCRAHNRDLPIPADPDDPVLECRGTVGLSPERIVDGRDLAIRAITRLFQLTDADSLERRILVARADGVLAPRHLAKGLAVPMNDILAALKRLRRREEEVARHLGFASRRHLLGGGRA